MFLFMDSFDHYTTTTQILRKYASFTQSPSISSTYGRFGNGLHTDDITSVVKDLGASYQTLIVGFAMKPANFGGGPIFQWRDSGTLQNSLVWSSQRLVFTRAGTTLGTGTHVLAVDTWYYVEIKVTVHNSTGSFEVRVGEELDSSGSGIDTQNSANASINQLWFGQTAGAQGTSMAWDDYYVCDDTGAVNNNFLGDLKIECLFPSADGNSSQFDGSDGNSSANYQLVDEVTPNDDTDYVQSADVGDEDTYTYGDLATTTGSVFAVQPIPYARKTDAGSRQIVSTARLSAVETDSLAKSLADTYLYLPDVRETKPGGGSWTITDVNNSEFGVKVSG